MALLYAPQHQLLVAGGKKGDVCIFDVRQRKQLHTFPVHDSSVRCMALDPCEEFFVTGSADGDIKVAYRFQARHHQHGGFENLVMCMPYIITFNVQRSR